MLPPGHRMPPIAASSTHGRHVRVVALWLLLKSLAGIARATIRAANLVTQHGVDHHVDVVLDWPARRRDDPK